MRQLDFFPDKTSPIGLIVRCPQRPCPDCRSVDASIERDGDHGELVCLVCDRHRSWLSKHTYDFIASIIKHSGRPTEPILLRIGSKNSSASGE